MIVCGGKGASQIALRGGSPSDGGCEIKWDWYRVSAYVADGVATIRTRNGHDWTKRFPAIAAAVERLPVRSAVIDGEAVILDDRQGPPSSIPI